MAVLISCTHSTIARGPRLHPLLRPTNPFLRLPTRRTNRDRQSVVVCALDLSTATKVVYTSNTAWEESDKNKDGELALTEVVGLLNSREWKAAISDLLNVQVAGEYTEHNVSEVFNFADRDKNRALSKVEFMILCLLLAKERVQGDPLILAEAVLGFLDHDRNGKLDAGEVKKVMALCGFPMAALLPIPEFVQINYKDLIGHFRK